MGQNMDVFTVCPEYETEHFKIRKLDAVCVEWRNYGELHTSNVSPVFKIGDRCASVGSNDFIIIWIVFDYLCVGDAGLPKAVTVILVKKDLIYFFETDSLAGFDCHGGVGSYFNFCIDYRLSFAASEMNFCFAYAFSDYTEILYIGYAWVVGKPFP